MIKMFEFGSNLDSGAYRYEIKGGKETDDDVWEWRRYILK
jgi:hypothetical protein